MSFSAGSLLSGGSNYSIIGLAAYWALAIAPHGVSIHIASNGNAATWDNRNPRAEGLKEKLKKKLGPERYAKYERSEAAHYNSIENFAPFAVAVIVANLAKLPAADINQFVAGVLAIRTLYIAFYIQTSTQSVSMVRSALYFAQIGWVLKTIVAAGLKFV